MPIVGFELEPVNQLFQTIAENITKPVNSKGITKQRKARQTVILTCVSDEYGGDVFTLKFTRKLPHEYSPSRYCDKCGDDKRRSVAIKARYK